MEQTSPSLRVAVIGAGPAGLRAAQALAEAGLHPVLIDESPEPGGQIYRKPPRPLRALRSPKALYGRDWRRAQALEDMLETLRDRIELRMQTLVWNAQALGARGFQLLLRGPEGDDETLEVRALVLATGAMDRILPVPGWTAPGVWSLGGAQVMLKAQAQVVGRRPVFAGSGPLLYLVAWQYAKAGARPAAVIDAASFGAKLRALPGMLARPGVLMQGTGMALALRRMGVPVLEGCHGERIEATPEGLTLHWRGASGAGKVTGDAIALGHGLKPERQLADLLGCKAEFDPRTGQWLVQTDPDGRSSVPLLYLAGDMVAINGAHAAEFAGELAARALLRDLHLNDPAPTVRAPALRRAMTLQRVFRRAVETAFPFPEHRIAGLPDDTMVCRCEGVTAGDLRRAIADWQPSDVNRLKAMTRCGMGRCQSRLCGNVAAGLLAAETGIDRARAGALRGQVPVKPITAPMPSSQRGVAP